MSMSDLTHLRILITPNSIQLTLVIATPLLEKTQTQAHLTPVHISTPDSETPFTVQFESLLDFITMTL